MKKYICILASAALLAACEQKTETAAPGASPGDETNTTIVNPSPTTSMETTPMATMTPMETPMATMTPATTDSSTTETTTTTTSPTP